MKKTLPILALVLGLQPALLADVTLPAIISDHMVLEKSAKVPIWGKAEPGEKVTVTLDGKTATATADANGKWKVILNLENSGTGPFEMVVQGKNYLSLTDVVVGEVWVASGQSNMEMALRGTADAAKDAAESANPFIRQFAVTRATSGEPLDDCKGAWISAKPETTGGFTAVGYYFAKKIQNELKVPVGLIHTSWGGTPAEAWTSAEALDTVPDLKAAQEARLQVLKEYPGKKQAFVDAMSAWLKENGREDKPAQDVAPFAGADAPTEGWTPVKLPGSITGEGLPEAGAVWIRHIVDVPADALGKPFGLMLGAIDGFDRVYWNGELVKETSYETYPGTGYIRQWNGYEVPAKLLKAGPNVLAIRLFEPVAPAKFPQVPRAGVVNLPDGWVAKAEYAFPPIDAAKVAAAPRPPANFPGLHHSPAHLFNGMINPIIPYAIRGVIWYQGETNAGRAWQYRTTFPLMITDWRKRWDQGDFPFYFCQLAAYLPKKPEPGESSWAELREAQARTLSLPQTGQAVLIDVGESGDIHPRNKKDAGERLARIALAKDYGKNIAWSGPVYESMKAEKGAIRLKFTQADGGLVARPLPATYDVKTAAKETAPMVRNSPQSELEGFAICGADKKWVWADAKIDGDTVVVSSDKVPEPVAVRYAWADMPTCNLYNGAGLPASPFRTDDFPASTIEGKY